MAEAQGPRNEVGKGHQGPEHIQDGLDVDMNLEEERFYVTSDHKCHEAISFLRDQRSRH